MTTQSVEDRRLLARLKRLDDDDRVSVSDWEGDFLETMVRLHAACGSLTPKQRRVAERVLEKFDR